MSKKKTIKFDALSKISIDKAIDELQRYQDGVIRKTQKLAKELAEIGVEYAKMQIEIMDAIDTEELLNSIQKVGANTQQGATFFIMATSEHAVFVEFGTGYDGLSSPYPGEFPEDLGWNYVSGDQITKNATMGIYGWFYNKDGTVYFTTGMESRPFMWNTSIELRNKVEKIAKEIFSNG